MSSVRPPLSVVIITLDAVRQLGALLDSVAFADEVVVVDSGSNDGTVELARARGAKIVHQPWLGFGRQKQVGVAAASHDWVLCLDADERVTPELGESIARALGEACHHAYEFARSNRFMGRYLRHGEGYPDWSVRLFDRRHACWSEDEVHEKVLTSAPVGRLSGDLLHDTAETVEDYLTKQNRYTSLAARALHAQGRRAAAGQLLLSPLVRFLKFYLVRRGFLDGLPGLAHILIGCMNSFVKYAKLIELQRRGPAPAAMRTRRPD
ncbi:MAG: glycosyltransferase family 2 protein [Betaproteobacteria bacterium]|nr:glycosyltransferase family 2 protein [Betaproteobacteria bacterium]